MKKLDNLRWNPKWVTHLGCIKGCLEYLGIDVSDAWLYGATGHAFVINIHEELCPSGPTAWKTEALFELGKNIGYVVDRVVGFKSAQDFAEKQRLAWKIVRESIDKSLPCYAWELDIPEFYVVYGYDEVGYYFRHFDNSGKGPKPWDELGKTGIGVLEMCAVKPGKAADDAYTVKSAFEFVLEYSKSPPQPKNPYKAGIAGYDNWISALETGKVNGFGNAFNAVVWNECRGFAVQFLKEAKERLGNDLSPLFDEAIEYYGTTAVNLEGLSKVFPFHGPNTKGDEVKEAERVEKGLELLKAARNAEDSGLKIVEKILRKL